MTESHSMRVGGLSFRGSRSPTGSSYSGRINRGTVQEEKTKGHTPTGSFSGFASGEGSSAPNRRPGSGDFSQYSGQSSPKLDPSSNDTHHINYESFNEYLRKLKPYLNEKIENLTVNLKEVLLAVTFILKQANPADRAKLDAALRRVLLEGSPAMVKYAIGTVGSKIFGCSSSSCQGVELGCSPTCANGIPSDPSVTGWAPCANSVYSFNGDSFELLSPGTTDSKNAIIYVSKSDFTGFNLTQIQDLNKKGVEAARIIYYDNDSCTHISPTFVPVTQIRSSAQTEARKAAITATGEAVKKADTDNDSSTFWWWVLGIVIVIVVIVALVWFAKYRKEKKAYAAELPESLLSNMTQPPSGLVTGLTPPARSPIFSGDMIRSMASRMSSNPIPGIY